MKIFIITMEDPVFTIPFIKTILDARANDIAGIATARGDRLRIGRKKSKLAYVVSLALIMGAVPFARFSMITVWFRFRRLLARLLPAVDPSILAYATGRGIPVFKNIHPNDPAFLSRLREIGPDVIIHQSQCIIRKELIDLPRIGVINRHNALLPKNRGRLTPFWVLYRKEKMTGVSIHLVNEGIDAGPVIVQEKFEVAEGETFSSLVRKNYEIAPRAMLKALDMLERGDTTRLPNDDSLASCNSIPDLKQAWDYRMMRTFGRRAEA